MYEDKLKCRWIVLLVLCVLAMMLVEETPAQEMIIVDTPATVVVCFEASPGFWSCS